MCRERRLTHRFDEMVAMVETIEITLMCATLSFEKPWVRLWQDCVRRRTVPRRRPVSSDGNVPNANFDPDNRQLKFDRDNAANPNPKDGFRLSMRGYPVRTLASHPPAMRESSATWSLHEKN